MRKSMQIAAGIILVACLMAWPAGVNAQSQSQSQGSSAQQGQQGTSGQSGQTNPQQGQQGGTQDPNATQGTGGIPVNVPPPPPPPPDATTPATAPAAKEPGSDAPIQQQQTVHPKNANEDVDAIGNRNPGKGLDWYSLEHEIALGKQLAQEVERSSKLLTIPW